MHEPLPMVVSFVITVPCYARMIAVMMQTAAMWCIRVDTTLPVHRLDCCTSFEA